MAERPRGLVHVDDLVSVDEEAALLRWCDGLETMPMVMHGVASRRRVRHFGVSYDADSRATVAAEPVPDELLGLRELAAQLGQVSATSLAEALVTCYPPDAGIGWHRDAAAFGPVVVGVSLRADAVMRFQRRAAGGERRVFEQPLARRSAYVLAGAARATWQHSVPHVKEERWSVTFRQLRRAPDAAASNGYGRGMTTTPEDHTPEPQENDKPGAEIGMTEGEGSTFEPEEDPEAHAPS